MVYSWQEKDKGAYRDENERFDREKARRAGPHDGGDPLYDRRLQPRGDPGLSDVRHDNGHLFPRHGPARDAGPDHGHDAQRRDAGSVGCVRRQGGQTLDRRRGRQDLARARADGGEPRREDGEDVRPRPRPYGRHARQAREHSGLQHQPAHGALSGECGPRRHGHCRPDGEPRPRRQEALRPARRDRHRGEHPAHRQQHHVQEAGRRCGHHRAGRQVRQRFVYEDAGRCARARDRDGRNRQDGRP